MRLIKTKDGYRIPSSSQKNQFYEVDPKKKSCTCAQYLFRARKVGGTCKHIDAVLEHLGSMKKNEKEELLEVVKKLGPIDFVKLAESYSEDLINQLIDSGDLIEEKGRIRLLK
ncbi:hypothetical protein JW968_06950 [Candidatus Woesearchaeota archaeon]|nr:hypothetical protein [Candidatus Woesearchaeota archaeon]